MSRTYVVTGSASGIGQAVKEILVERGDRVIGVDLKNADVIADLATPAGRQHMVDAVAEIAGGSLDGVVSCAGLMAGTSADIIMSVNFFGAIATLDGLRPLLLHGDRPRAVVMASFAIATLYDAGMVDACREMDEQRARTLALEVTARNGNTRIVYNSSKRAVARWVRRMAPSENWGGSGIAINAVAPGITHTPMNARFLATEEGSAQMKRAVPMAYHGVISPREMATAVVWLASPESSAVTGQVLFVDGGADCVVNGDDLWCDQDWPRPADLAAVQD